MSEATKITSAHLARAAVIYVRQSTLAQLERNTESTARQYDLVAGIVQLARTLKLDVVAEGIETSTERTLLSGAGCAYGQGYLFAKPMPATDVVAWLVANMSVPA